MPSFCDPRGNTCKTLLHIRHVHEDNGHCISGLAERTHMAKQSHTGKRRFDDQ